MTTKFTLIFAFLLLGMGAAFSFLFHQNQPMNPTESNGSKPVRYIALGDSYTIGEGIAPEDSWPTVLTRHLQQNGIQIELVANPSRTGWTTLHVIDRELPVFDRLDPSFATLLIGVNDYVQGVDINTFRSRLAQIIDHVLAKLPRKENFVLVTIPDYSVTPTGSQFSGPATPQDIQRFNQVIKEEAARRNIPVVDIYPLSQKMKDSPDLIISDGLHPSGKEYALWEELIYPVAEGILSLKSKMKNLKLH